MFAMFAIKVPSLIWYQNKVNNEEYSKIILEFFNYLVE